MDGVSAFLGTLFLSTMVGGTTLLGMFYLSVGLYALGVIILLPLIGIAAWMAADLHQSSAPDDF